LTAKLLTAIDTSVKYLIAQQIENGNLIFGLKYRQHFVYANLSR